MMYKSRRKLIFIQIFAANGFLVLWYTTLEFSELLRDMAFTWRPRELSYLLKKWLILRKIAIRTVYTRRLRDSFCLFTVSLSRQRHDISFGFYPLSFVTPRFACDIGQSACKDLDLSFIRLRSSTSAFSGWPVHQPITSLLATPCWRDPTSSKQLSTVAILNFQFGLYHVFVPLSFLRSMTLATLFSSHFGAHLNGHQYGFSIQISINLG